MKGGNSPTNFGRRILLAVFAAILTSLANPLSCQALQTAILLRQSPTEGGIINLGEGVHQFEQYTEITLTAIPKSGWQFVCWLGDVSDTSTPATTAFIDAPKIIIAVFERAAYEFLIGEIGATSCAWPKPDFKCAKLCPGGGRRHTEISAASTSPTPPPPPPPPPSDKFPVPQKFPVPLPEPTTVILLALGGMYAFRKHTYKRANPR